MQQPNVPPHCTVAVVVRLAARAFPLWRMENSSYVKLEISFDDDDDSKCGREGERRPWAFDHTGTRDRQTWPCSRTGGGDEGKREYELYCGRYSLHQLTARS